MLSEVSKGDTVYIQTDLGNYLTAQCTDISESDDEVRFEFTETDSGDIYTVIDTDSADEYTGLKGVNSNSKLGYIDSVKIITND
jgi:hypothetical protein